MVSQLSNSALSMSLSAKSPVLDQENDFERKRTILPIAREVKVLSHEKEHHQPGLICGVMLVIMYNNAKLIALQLRYWHCPGVALAQ